MAPDNDISHTLKPRPAFPVRLRVDPFSNGAAVVYHYVGDTISDVLAKRDFKPERVTVSVNGYVIAKEYYGRVKPREGVTVVVDCVPGAATTAAYMVSNFILTHTSIAYTSSLVMATLQTATALALVYDVGTGLRDIFQHGDGVTDGRTPERETLAGNSLTGARNRALQFRPLPFVLGKRRFAPPLAANPFTEKEGDNEHINTMVCWGPATNEISEVRIGATSIGSYNEVEAQHDLAGSGTITSFPDVSERRYNIHLEPSEWFGLETDGDVDRIGITFEFPNGLYKLRNSSATANFGIRYRKVGATDWVSFSASSVTRNSKTRVLSYEEIIPASRGRYEIEVRRETPGAAENPSNEGDIVGRSFLTSVKSISDTQPVKAAGVSLSYYKVRSTNQLNGTLDEINAICGIKVPVYDPATSAWTATRAVSQNPADLYRFILTDGNVNDRPLAATQLDDASLGEWWTFCNSNDYKYNKIITGQDTVNDLLGEIAKAGMALPKTSAGKYGVVINRARTAPVQMFTPRNSNNFQQNIVMRPLPHALRVTFDNENVDFEKDEIIVYDEGYTATNATRYESIRLPGVTNPDQVYKIARYILACGRLRPRTFTFDADYEHLVCEIGDWVKLQHDAALVGQTSGRVKTVGNGSVGVDEPVTFESGKQYVIAVRKTNMEIVTQTATAPSIGSTYTVNVGSVAGISVGDQFSFGEQILDCEVRKIESKSDLAARVTAVPLAPAVFNAAEYIPPYTTHISRPVGPSFAGPQTPVILAVRSDVGGYQQDVRGVPIPSIRVDFRAPTAPYGNDKVTQPQYAIIRWKPLGADEYSYDEVLAEAGSYHITPVTIGTEYDIGVQFIDRHQGFSGWDTETHVAGSFIDIPEPVDSFEIVDNGQTVTLEWTYENPSASAIHYEIKFCFTQNETDINKMFPLGNSIGLETKQYTANNSGGTYAIRVINEKGLYSRPSFVNAPNAVARTGTRIINENNQPNFTGTKINTAVVNGTLHRQLSADGSDFVALDSFYWKDIDLGSVQDVTVFLDCNISHFVVLGNTILKWPEILTLGKLLAPSTQPNHKIDFILIYSETPNGFGYSPTNPDAFSTPFAKNKMKAKIRARYLRIMVYIPLQGNDISPVIDRLGIQVYTNN